MLLYVAVELILARDRRLTHDARIAVGHLAVRQLVGGEDVRIGENLVTYVAFQTCTTSVVLVHVVVCLHMLLKVRACLQALVALHTLVIGSAVIWRRSVQLGP